MISLGKALKTIGLRARHPSSLYSLPLLGHWWLQTGGLSKIRREPLRLYMALHCPQGKSSEALHSRVPRGSAFTKGFLPLEAAFEPRQPWNGSPVFICQNAGAVTAPDLSTECHGPEPRVS